VISNTSNSLSAYHDIARLNELKFKASDNAEASLLEVAKQFESIFLNMMLKTARSTIVEGGIFKSPQLKTYQQMFDQQASVDLSSKGGIGLAEVIVRQLQTQGIKSDG
jgi:peptidoglycan hydrolase FlgJ